MVNAAIALLAEVIEFQFFTVFRKTWRGIKDVIVVKMCLHHNSNWKKKSFFYPEDNILENHNVLVPVKSKVKLII